MKLVVSVALREYEPDLFIAQTLYPPLTSAAGPSAQEAIAGLREVLVHELERAHPRMLWRLEAAAKISVRHDQLPIYRSAAHDWSSTGSPRIERLDASCEVHIVIRELPGGLEEVSFPLFGVSTCALPPEAGVAEEDEDGSEASPDQIDVAIGDLVREVRRSDRSLWTHRPNPRDFSVLDLEVVFEPIDLQSISVENLWAPGFEDEMIETEETAGSSPTPTLERVAHSWTDLDEEEAIRRGFKRALQRKATIDELTGLLSGKEPSSVVLVGPSRVGKTTLIKHLAWQKITGNDEERRIWFANPPRLTSADPMVGWQQQCRDIVVELEEAGDILYLGRISEALDAGKYFGSDYNLAQFLKPTLTDRRIRVVAEATVEEWNDVERRDIGFARCFTVIRVEDPRDEIAVEIVQEATRKNAERLGIDMSKNAARRAWSLQKRFSTEGSPVGRTIDFVARTLRQAANHYQKEVSDRDLVMSFCQDTGLPPVMLLDDMRLDIERVKDQLASRVMGQELAVERVADVIGITKAGLASEDRPLGSFLFVGPTGVGKTELARTLAEFLFGSDDRLIRLDMSEYSHGDAYNRLIGAGGEDGDLTGPVRRQPFSVVLLDELEKGHPSVFDLLLQVLGEARLTDVQGRTTRFQNTIIVMTSNLGVDSLRPSIGFDSGDEDVNDVYATHFRREAERFFRPEFLARIDQFIPFHALSLEVVEKIAERELQKVTRREGLLTQDVDLHFADGLIEWLARRGWDEKYGARPLKRVIEQELMWQLSAELARTREEIEEGITRSITAGPANGDIDAPGLHFDTRFVSGDETESAARQTLLKQIDEIANLRRRLQRYTYTNVFTDLEWEVDNFDISSQSAAFWQDPNAAMMATRAEHARRVIEPAQEVMSELAALEDLASEAFYSRTFALSTDLTERVDELQQRVSDLILTVLRAAYDDPDHAALFFVSKTHDDPWRNKLLGWYRQRAERHGWEVKGWSAIDDFESIEMPEDRAFDENRQFWEEDENPTGLVVALEFEGYAVRALMRAEDGLQRMVSSDGNAVVEVMELDEYDGWPFPQSLVDGRPYARVVRTYNFRTNEVLIPGYEPMKFDSDDPWKVIEPTVEDHVWEITEMEWE